MKVERERERESRRSLTQQTGGSEFQVRGAAVLYDRLANDETEQSFSYDTSQPKLC